MNRIQERVRSDCTDLGLLMMDVPSKRKQESVDKRIIADIGLCAADLAQSTDIGILVLVSGDSDYGYILSRLRNRSYIKSIIVFGNNNTKDTLKIHADKYFSTFYHLSPFENPFSMRNLPKEARYNYYQNKERHEPYPKYNPFIKVKSSTTMVYSQQSITDNRVTDVSLNNDGNSNMSMKKKKKNKKKNVMIDNSTRIQKVNASKSNITGILLSNKKTQQIFDQQKLEEQLLKQQNSNNKMNKQWKKTIVPSNVTSYVKKEIANVSYDKNGDLSNAFYASLCPNANEVNEIFTNYDEKKSLNTKQTVIKPTNEIELHLRMVTSAVKYVRNTQKRIPNYSGIHNAMKKLNAEYMSDKNFPFTKRCITLAVSYGFVEVVGDRCISEPNTLPLILLVCNKQSVIATYVMGNGGKKYYMMSDLSKYLCKMYPLASANFACKYLYNIINSTTKYFRILQSDTERYISGANYGNIHFRLRSQTKKLYQAPNGKKANK